MVPKLSYWLDETYIKLQEENNEKMISYCKDMHSLNDWQFESKKIMRRFAFGGVNV